MTTTNEGRALPAEPSPFVIRLISRYELEGDEAEEIERYAQQVFVPGQPATPPAELAALRAELSEATARALKAEAFIAGNGYRRCDIPACNCGSWHGGTALKRLMEIQDALKDGGCRPMEKTALVAVCELLQERDDLRDKLQRIADGAKADADDLAKMRDGSKLTRNGLVSLIVYLQEDVAEMKARAERAEKLLGGIPCQYCGTIVSNDTHKCSGEALLKERKDADSPQV